jgi:hypothetical protein
MTRSYDAALELLVAALREPDRAAGRLLALPPEQVPGVIAVARAHAVEAWLAAIVEPAQDDRWAALTEQRQRFIAARARTVGELHRLAGLLDELGCPWLAVKGQVLAEQLYPRPHMRFGVDIDVLVDPRSLPDVLRCLQDAGWQLLDRNWPLIAATEPGELRLRSPHGNLLDLHWHLLNFASMRAQYRLPTAELLERRRRTASGIPALDPADQLIHLAVHSASSGANKLLWLLDTGLAASQFADYDLLVERVRASRTALALALVMLRCQRYLGLSLPSEVLAAAGAGPGWQLLCRTVDARSRLRDDPERPMFGRAFARAVRATAPASAGDLLGRGGSWLRSGAPHHRLPSTINDPLDPGSPLFPDEDIAARERYLRTIASSG